MCVRPESEAGVHVAFSLTRSIRKRNQESIVEPWHGFVPNVRHRAPKVRDVPSHADVARDLPRLVQSHIDAGVTGIFQQEGLAFAVAGHALEPDESPNTMIEMDHVVIRLELGKIGRRTTRQNSLATLRAATLAERR